MRPSLPASILNIPGEARMLDAVRSGLSWAGDVRMAVSFTRCSGLQLIIEPLKEVVARGGSARLLTSTYQALTQPEALSTLLAVRGLECRVQDGPIGFHSKFWMFLGKPQTECWAGSSNLTKGGLVTNLEWNLRQVEPHIQEAKRQFERLWARSDVHPLSSAFIEAYRTAYAKAQEGSARLAPTPIVPEPNAAQAEALRALQILRERGERRAAVIAATGVGKTYLAAFDVKASGAHRVLYVSHQREHLRQAHRSFARIFGPRARLGLLGRDDCTDADIVFATVQSLPSSPALLGRGWDYLIIDEFHHATAPSYQPLRSLRDSAFLLGLTATPERQDGHDVLEWCDWNIGYEIRLPEAIERSLLRPFHYFGVADDTIDWTKFSWRRLADVALEDMLLIEQRAELVLGKALQYGFDGPRRAAVGFCAGVRHAHYMADYFNRNGQVALAVDGRMDPEIREKVYRRLASPDDPLEWLFVADLLNEGVDIPAINAVLFLRPTESATVFLQQLGRGLRLSPGTEVLTVLDFVGMHRSAWERLSALSDAKGTGARVQIGDNVYRPPAGCEIVLERRTLEMLAKIERHTTSVERCRSAYAALRAELGRPPLPVDLSHRDDLPTLSEFRAKRTWLDWQREHEEAPSWAVGLAVDHPVCLLLASVEKDWQAQRVGVYALVWGLCQERENPEAGYEAFFRRWPQWQPEYLPLGKTWATLAKKLPPGVLDGNRLHPAIHELVGDDLLPQVEGRILYTLNKNHQERHGGILRTPSDLVRTASYSRPEIIRHFGVQYDPAKHNVGIQWFGNDAVIITKLNTDAAKKEHQYLNRFSADGKEFSWTSQNRMSPTNEAGRRVTEHASRGTRLHLFVQAGSHQAAVYVGPVQVRGATGAEPMTVQFEIEQPLPADILAGLVQSSTREADVVAERE